MSLASGTRRRRADAHTSLNMNQTIKYSTAVEKNRKSTNIVQIKNENIF